jgi:hypothetical protein
MPLFFCDFYKLFMTSNNHTKPLQTRTTAKKNKKARAMRAFRNWSG